jgi:hypothetical protein
MHVDYVLVAAKTQRIILAIELDDKSHNTPEALERDDIKNGALRRARIKYARIRVENMYNIDNMKKIVDFCAKESSTEQ